MRRSGPVGVGIIGAGVISSQYLTNLTAFPDVAVVFVADIDAERARSQAAAFGVASWGSVEELLGDPRVEIVVNLTIPRVHVEVATRALEAGKHVWTEKPFSMDRETGRQLLALAHDRGLRVASAPDTFLGPGLRTAQRIIERGEIGRPLTGLALFQVAGPESWHPSPEFLFAVGGGPLFDVGPYYLTALVQNLGAVASVAAMASRAHAVRTIGSGPRAGTEFDVEVPTHVGGLLQFENGTSAQGIWSFDSHLHRAGVLEITGAEGTIVLPDPNTFDGDVLVWRRGIAEPETFAVEPFPHSRGIGVVDLARSIRSGSPERATGELGFHIVDIMVSLSESAERGEAVPVRSSVTIDRALPETWDPREATLPVD
jgi:predicted dehydrogenase